MSFDNKYLFYFIVWFITMDIFLTIMFENYIYVLILFLVAFLMNFFIKNKSIMLILSYFIASIIEIFGYNHITFFKIK